MSLCFRTDKTIKTSELFDRLAQFGIYSESGDTDHEKKLNDAEYILWAYADDAGNLSHLKVYGSN
jgi:hypothetical protein